MSDQPEALRLADRLDLWGDQNDLLEAAAELRRQHDEIETLREAYRLWMSVPQIQELKAERDALKAAAEKGTEYVLAHINQDLRAERDALLADAERYRWLRRKDREFINDEMSNVGAVDSIMVCVFDDDCDAISFFEGELDAAIDAAREVKP